MRYPLVRDSVMVPKNLSGFGFGTDLVKTAEVASS
jgi:hypothetical protein